MNRQELLEKLAAECSEWLQCCLLVGNAASGLGYNTDQGIQPTVGSLITADDWAAARKKRADAGESFEEGAPDRIWVDVWDGEPELTQVVNGKSVEYVRADLAAGDASEPLEVGQYRWALKPGIGWFVVVIHKWHGDFFWYPSGNDYTIYAVDELSEIGPVIRPPSNTAN